ncbi:MAG TPA: hypothetical protein VKU00_08030 [Chthonomonadaceae bacterium]|nr:hypothetical protein [Chthonomonadaceae bacterium]
MRRVDVFARHAPADVVVRAIEKGQQRRRELLAPIACQGRSHKESITEMN